MSEPTSHQILYPLFAMFYLVAFVLGRMAWLRLTAVQTRKMKMSFYRTYDEGEETPDLRVVTRHFLNLFEVPLLFYIVIILTYVTQQVSGWMIACAWTYVALRYLHSYIHLGANDVTRRFQAFFASGVVLVILWTSLLLQLLRAS